MFRLRNTDRTQSILPHKKNGQPRQMTIRAPNPQSKHEWIEAIKRCCRKYHAMEQQDLVQVSTLPSLPIASPSFPFLPFLPFLPILCIR